VHIALIAPTQQDYCLEEAADLVQETYYRLLRRGGTIELDFMARALLFHTATNLARDHLHPWRRTPERCS
jgi:DNA-directed RNA polymerase specialized sigma24 family protein